MILENENWQDFEKSIIEVWRDPNFSWDDGESNQVAQQRGVDALNNLLDRYPNEHIAIGSHGNLMVLIMNYFDVNYDFAFWHSLSMPAIYQLKFSERKLLSVQRIWEKD